MVSMIVFVSFLCDRTVTLLLCVEWQKIFLNGKYVCRSASGGELLRPRRRSLASSSSSRLLSLAEARAREDEAIARERAQSVADHRFDSSSLPSKYRAVFYEPKRSDFILLC